MLHRRLFAASLLFQWNSLRLGLLGVPLLATGAALARRWHHLRLAATAFLAGVLGAGTLVVVVVLGEVAGLSSCRSRISDDTPERCRVHEDP